MSSSLTHMPVNPKQLRDDFADPPAECRPMVRWWWFGCAVTPKEIERELQEMLRQGIGGVELQPVYPHSLDDPGRGIRNIPYMSDEWLELMKFAMRKARELGMVFDATFGSGWPFGGPHVPLRMAAKKLRCAQVDVFDQDEVRLSPPVRLLEGEAILAITATPLRPDGTLDLDSRVHIDLSQESWQSPRGQWRVMWFIEGHTLQEVKRAALGAEGLVIDHYDRNALDLHASVVGRAYKALADEVGPGSVRAMFCDSWEVYGANWTGELPDRFRERRGYDLAEYLPALWNDIGPETPYVRWDYRRTVSEMALEEFFRPFSEWCERNGFLARVQAHGTPADLLQGYGAAHIPEGESYGAQLRFRPSPDEGIPAPAGLYHRTFSASAAVLFGRKLCSSESYTWLRNPRFMVSLEDIKACSDIQFTQGVNNVVCHGYSCSPPQAGVPGWVFYASSMINHNNTWWPYFRHAADYVGRACLMLRQGEPASSLCIYMPANDVWAEAEQPPRSSGAETVRRLPEELFRSLRLAGYQYDFVDDDSLAERADITGDRLLVGQGGYEALLLPCVKRITPAAAARASEFAARGGTVIFVGRLPDSSCSLTKREEETDEVQRLVKETLESGALLVPSESVADELSRRVRANLIIEPADPDIGFRHRKDGAMHVYFLANVSSEEKRFAVRAPVTGSAVQVWDAVSGRVFAASEVVHGNGGVSVNLRLEPFGSLFLTISEEADADLPVWPMELGREVGAIELVEGWRMSVPEDADAVPVPGLVSWTEWPHLVHFSGRGRYGIEFEMDRELGEGQSVWLELGEVREVAEVRLNGEPAGVTWKRPHRLEVAGLVRKGRNVLEVTVTNLLINRVLGGPESDYSDLVSAHGRRFPPDSEKRKAVPAPSGLLGPARLVITDHT